MRGPASRMRLPACRVRAAGGGEIAQPRLRGRTRGLRAPAADRRTGQAHLRSANAADTGSGRSYDRGRPGSDTGVCARYSPGDRVDTPAALREGPGPCGSVHKRRGCVKRTPVGIARDRAVGGTAVGGDVATAFPSGSPRCQGPIP